VLSIFSLAQVEIWIFASGFPSFLPALFLVTALVAIGTLRSTRARFITCAMLAVASSFTLSHGLLAWGLTFSTLPFVQSFPKWRSWLALWLGACATCATIYFWGYSRPSYHPPFAPAAPPLEYARFILEFLGGGLAYSFNDHDGVAIFFGALQLGLYLLALAYTARRLRDHVFLAKVVPWFTLGLYSIGSAGLAALGRIGFGASYALASRYVTFSIYLTVAVIPLFAIIGREIVLSRSSSGSCASRAWVLTTGLILAITYLIPYTASATNSLFFLRALSAKDRLARGAVLFSAALDTSDVIKKTAYPNDAAPVVQNAAALDRLNLMRPPLIQTDRLGAMPHETADGKHVSGFCETVTTVSGQLCRVSGWAVLNAKGRPADCVLVAYQDPRRQEWIACAISDSFEMRADAVKRFRSMDQLWAGWTATFSRRAIPAGAKLSFWAVDADEPMLYQLADQSSSKGQ
jgi:hypothetical protein